MNVSKNCFEKMTGKFLINGKDAAQANKMVMKPGDKVILRTPGGGGYGAAS